MTEVRPFKAIIYNTDRVKGDEVVSPPYDVISEELKEELYAKSPFNIVRIDFGKVYNTDNEKENRYTRAKSYLDEWLSQGILRETPSEAYYLYEVKYKKDNKDISMRGLFGRVRLTELCKGVFPHEATHSKPKADRLNLMKYCKANLSPIFSIYRSRKKHHHNIFDKYINQTPYISALDQDGFRHSMWIIDDPADVNLLREELASVEIYIADGHHRYETALEYQRLQKELNADHTGDEPYNFVLMYLVDIEDGGLTILPTHRIIEEINVEKQKLLDTLSGYFNIKEVNDIKRLPKEIASSSYPHAIGMLFGFDESGYILSYESINVPTIDEPLRTLDVTILHEIIIKGILRAERVTYEMNPQIVMEGVVGHKDRIAFFLNPTRVEDVERVAKACLRMPPKATYFYPKILTGFVINRLE